MADVSANTSPKQRARGQGRYPIADASTIYIGGLVGLEAGYIDDWADSASTTFLGILRGGDDEGRALSDAVGTLVGKTSLTPDPGAFVDETGRVLTGLTVLGTPTQAKVGDRIWCDTSNVADITLTPADGKSRSIGWMSGYASATDQDVTLYTPSEFQAQRTSEYLLAFNLNMIEISDNDLVTDWTIGHAFEVLDLWFLVTEATTTVSKLSTLSLDIGSTVITNSEIALTTANTDATGDIVANAGALALNVGTATDTLTVKAASTTAFGEGSGTLMVRIRVV